MPRSDGSWVAVRLLRPDLDHDAPVLAWLEGESIYWDGGPGHCPFDEQKYQVVKRYDWPKEDPDDAAFYREFGPQPEALRQSAGWLAPDGRFWPCEYGGHSELERELSFEIYGEYGTWNTIENRGWVKIYPDGLCVPPFRWVDHARHDISLTPAQGEALLDLVALDPDSTYGVQMKEQLTYLLKEDNDGSQ